MKLRYYSVALLVAILITFTVTSCREEWDAHYTTLPSDKSELNLYDYIKSQPD